jgi:hypothetical protein
MTQHRSSALMASGFSGRPDRVAPAPRPVRPSAVLTTLTDQALDAIEHALDGALPDARHHRRGEVPSYDEWQAAIADWAPEGRVRLGELIAALDAAGADVQQLVLRGASSGDERVVRSMESTVRRHQVVDACARRWLDLAKCVLAQQRGEPVDPQANWDRAWRARDEWTRMVRQRG